MVGGSTRWCGLAFLARCPGEEAPAAYGVLSLRVRISFLCCRWDLPQSPLSSMLPSPLLIFSLFSTTHPGWVRESPVRPPFP